MMKYFISDVPGIRFSDIFKFKLKSYKEKMKSNLENTENIALSSSNVYPTDFLPENIDSIKNLIRFWSNGHRRASTISYKFKSNECQILLY